MKRSKVVVTAVILGFLAVVGVILILPDNPRQNGEGGAERATDARSQEDAGKGEPTEGPEQKPEETSSLPEIPERTEEKKRKDFTRFLITGPPGDVRKIVEQRYQTGSKNERWSLYALLRGACIHTDDLKRRKLLIEYLLVGVKEDEEERDYILSKPFEANILRFYEEDFSPRARELLAEVIDRHGFEYTTVLLTGIADMERYYPKYRKLADDYFSGQQKDSVGRAAALVLARQDEDDYAQKVVHAIDSWDLTRVARTGLRELAYTRQPEAMERLRKYLNSDAFYGKHIYGPGGSAIAWRAAGTLSVVLKNCPVKVPDMTLKEHVSKVREWMDSHTGEWEFYESTSEWPEEWLEL